MLQRLRQAFVVSQIHLLRILAASSVPESTKHARDSFENAAVSVGSNLPLVRLDLLFAGAPLLFRLRNFSMLRCGDELATLIPFPVGASLSALLCSLLGCVLLCLVFFDPIRF